MTNRLKNFQSTGNTSLNKKIASVDDKEFLKRSGDTTKPAPNKLVLDDIDAVQKNNALINVVGAPQTNFAPFGNQLAAESSTTANAQPSETPPRTNPLHDFEPVNYLITLGCLDFEGFNNGFTGPELIIARSGGKGATSENVLGNDYYIDNLVVRNTVSPTSEGKSGTVFNVMFDVTEPYGTSFVDALITAAQTLGYENHLKALFKLKIEFKGVDDQQNPSGAPIGFSTRVIPIHIYAIEMRVEAGVTTYQVQARPATHLATTELHGVTQETITVNGSTVGELCEDFFNKHNDTLKKLKQDNRIIDPDVYTFGIDESDAEIIESKIPYDVNSSASNVFNISNVESPSARSQNLREVTVPAGTAMQAFIEAVVRESEFYRNQFDENGEPKGNREFLKALRTATRLKIDITKEGGGGNRPQYEFIWVLRGFKATSNYFKKEASDLASNVIPVRKYQYLYTGQNKDIIDFNVTYKFAFYQAIPYFKQGGNDDASTSTKSGNRPNENTEENTTGAKGLGTTQVSKEAERQYKDGFIADLNTVNGEVATIFEQIIQDPSADLLVTTMEIIGDPVWIEQKSVLNESYKDSFEEGSPSIDRFGAVTTDEYEVYVQVDFKTPTDLDDQTGLFKIQDAAFFEGKYKVFICESRFTGGMFTNVLQMVRMRHQATDQERENLAGEDVTTDGQDVAGGKEGSVYDDHILREQQKKTYETSRNVIASTGSVTGNNSSGNVTKTNSRAMEARGFNVNADNNINVGVTTNNNRSNYLKKLKFRKDNTADTVVRKNNKRLNLYNR